MIRKTMKKPLCSLVILFCVAAVSFSEAHGEGIGVEANPAEFGCYKILLKITSQSDWTTVRVVRGGRIVNVTYEVTEGSTAPELECWYDAHLDLFGMAKEQFDSTLVRIEVKAIVYIEDTTIVFEIQKGDIEYTSLEIYNYNGKVPILTKKVTNNLNITDDPENPLEISIEAHTLRAGGPLPLLSYPVPKLVWAFYYPWYYRNQWYTNEALIDTPIDGPHTSSDPDVIEMHIQQALSAGIDGFIVSWWGENDYTDQNLKIILDVASEYDFKITIYLESLGDGPRSEEELKSMFLSFFRSYGNDSRYYRVDGNPVIFVWAVESHPPAVWESIISDVEHAGYTGVYIAMTSQPDYLGVFNGLHLYGIVGIDNLSLVYERLSIACRTCGYLHESEERFLWAATMCPGYDDRKIPGRTGIYQPRENGEYYKTTCEAALNSRPDWLLITSFNEWYENTHIEPSVSYGQTYLDLTRTFSSEFKGFSMSTQEADSLFEQARKAYEEGDYETALTLFQQAKEKYEEAGSEKAKDCDEWIQKTQAALEKGFCSGTLLVAALCGLEFKILLRRGSHA